MSIWYAVYTKPREEERAFENLCNQHFDALLPLMRSKRRVAGKSRQVVQAMFPRYLFVALEAGTDNFSKIRSTRGCVDLVKFGGLPATVPTEFVDELKAFQGQFQDQIIDLSATEPKVGLGQQVSVMEGPFQGLMGEVCDLKANDRVVVLLELLGGKRKVEFKLEDIEKG